MLLPVNRDLEMESYDVEISTAGRVTELYGDITATAIACQAMVRQIEALLELTEMALDSGSRTWAKHLAGWVREDFEETDLMVASLNSDSLRAEREAMTESGRLIMYSHVVSQIADLRETFDRIQQEIEGTKDAEDAEDASDMERGFQKVGLPYVRVCSFYPAHRFVLDSLDDSVSNEVWLSTMKVVSLLAHRLEDAMIVVVGKAEWEADKSDPFYEQLRTSGRMLTERTLTAAMETYGSLIDEYNDRLEWKVSPTLMEESDVLRAARATMIAPGDFAWGCQEIALPGGEIALGDIFLICAHDGRRILQLLCEPYPEGFPAEKVVTHVETIFASLADLILEELPEGYVGESADRKMNAIRRAAEGGVHTVTKDMLTKLVPLACREGLERARILEMVRKVALDDREILDILCGFYRSWAKPTDEDICVALGIPDSPAREVALAVSEVSREQLSIEMKGLGFPVRSIEITIGALDG